MLFLINQQWNICLLLLTNQLCISIYCHKYSQNNSLLNLHFVRTLKFICPLYNGCSQNFSQPYLFVYYFAEFEMVFPQLIKQYALIFLKRETQQYTFILIAWNNYAVKNSLFEITNLIENLQFDWKKYGECTATTRSSIIFDSLSVLD